MRQAGYSRVTSTLGERSSEGEERKKHWKCPIFTQKLPSSITVSVMLYRVIYILETCKRIHQILSEHKQNALQTTVVPRSPSPVTQSDSEMRRYRDGTRRWYGRASYHSRKFSELNALPMLNSESSQGSFKIESTERRSRLSRTSRRSSGEHAM